MLDEDGASNTWWETVSAMVRVVVGVNVRSSFDVSVSQTATKFPETINQKSHSWKFQGSSDNLVSITLKTLRFVPRRLCVGGLGLRGLKLKAGMAVTRSKRKCDDTSPGSHPVKKVRQQFFDLATTSN